MRRKGLWSAIKLVVVVDQLFVIEREDPMAMDDHLKTDDIESPVLNQAEIMGILKIEFSRSRRYNCPLSCALIQIDRLERLRDMYGMGIAKEIYSNTIQMLNSNTRLPDYLGRMGDRFLLIMPHTDRLGAVITLNRIREKLSSLDFDISGKVIKVTLSVGLADNHEEDSIFNDSILKRAESSLKNVINRGGNGINVHDPSNQPQA